MVVNSLNYDLAEKLIRQKKVNYIQNGERRISLKFQRPVIDIGYILHVHIIKGDWVVMNRQLTLNRPSMMGFWSTPRRQNIQSIPRCNKTFECRLWWRWNQLSHSLKSHGDSRIKELMATPFHILSSKNGLSIICIVQDAMVNMLYLLTTRKDQIERVMFMQYLVDLVDLNRFNEIVSKLGYTGKVLFSFLLPRQLWHQTSKIRIENGWLMDGIIDKSSLGSSVRHW